MGALFVFPGQGSQQVGMGRAMVERYPAAAEVFAEAGRVLGFDLARICFEGPEEELRRTAMAQPALLATSIACLAPLRDAGMRPQMVAGHSLGEYTALVAAGALSFAEGLRLVARRGELMEAAAREAPGGMAAVLGLATEQVEQLCDACGASVANRNAPGQVVISGPTGALERVMAYARERGARRVMPLNVAGAFHSPSMAPAAEALRREIEAAELCRASVPVIANVSARPLQDPDEIRAALVEQLTGSVRWEESIRHAVAMGAERLIEIGPGTVLAGLFRRIVPELPVASVSDPATLEAVITGMSRHAAEEGSIRR
jgi:[acyl-carrier-protein] S-malonyltransferase